jgi:hypothetical protein
VLDPFLQFSECEFAGDESGRSEKVLDSLLTEGYFFLELWDQCVAHELPNNARILEIIEA